MNSKARLIIPALLIAATLIGSAYATFLVTTFTGTTNVEENISITPSSQTVANIFPNGDATFTFTVSNAAPNAQNVELDATLAAPTGVCISNFTADSTTVTSTCTSGSGTVPVPATSGMTTSSITVSIKVHAAGDAATGAVTVTINVSRAA